MCKQARQTNNQTSSNDCETSSSDCERRIRRTQSNVIAREGGEVMEEDEKQGQGKRI